MKGTPQPNVACTNYGEAVSNCELFPSGLAIAQTRIDWLLGWLRERQVTTRVAENEEKQLGLVATQVVVELDWYWSSSEDDVRKKATQGDHPR